MNPVCGDSSAYLYQVATPNSGQNYTLTYIASTDTQYFVVSTPYDSVKFTIRAIRKYLTISHSDTK